MKKICTHMSNLHLLVAIGVISLLLGNIFTLCSYASTTNEQANCSCCNGCNASTTNEHSQCNGSIESSACCNGCNASTTNEQANPQNIGADLNDEDDTSLADSSPEDSSIEDSSIADIQDDERKLNDASDNVIEVSVGGLGIVDSTTNSSIGDSNNNSIMDTNQMDSSNLTANAEATDSNSSGIVGEIMKILLFMLMFLLLGLLSAMFQALQSKKNDMDTQDALSIDDNFAGGDSAVEPTENMEEEAFANVEDESEESGDAYAMPQEEAQEEPQEELQEQPQEEPQEQPQEEPQENAMKDEEFVAEAESEPEQNEESMPDESKTSETEKNVTCPGNCKTCTLPKCVK